jgi:hypothetical protein
VSTRLLAGIRNRFDKFTVVRKRTAGRRALARVVTIAVGATVPVLAAAGPALALKRDDGTAAHYPSLGAGLTILIFVVIPVGVFAIISALALLPSALSKPRYRPGNAWEHGSRWFGKPAEGETVTADSSAPNPSARGGASAEW